MTFTRENGGIDFFQLAARKGALKLELAGLHRRGQSVYSICKQVYGLKGSRESVLAQMEKLVEDALIERSIQAGLQAREEANQ